MNSQPNIKTIADTKIADTKATDKDIHDKITTTTTKTPDGGETITQTETKDTVTKTEETKDTDSHVVTTITAAPKVNLAGLAGIDFSKKTPVYGASISKQLLGPVTLGVWGLTNSTIGVSIGLEF